MTEHNLFYYPYASFTNAQLPLLKVAARWFDQMVILDPVGATWDAVGADHHSQDCYRIHMNWLDRIERRSMVDSIR